MKPARLAIILFCGAVLAVAAVFLSPLYSRNKLPGSVLEVFEAADVLEVLSLHPEHSETALPGNYHGWKVLGRTPVTSESAREKIVETILQGIRENDGMVAGCFEPRHGIRATRNGQTAELVICFACASMRAYLDGQVVGGALTTGTPQPLLDQVLRESGVQLAPTSGE